MKEHAWRRPLVGDIPILNDDENSLLRQASCFEEKKERTRSDVGLVSGHRSAKNANGGYVA